MTRDLVARLRDCWCTDDYVKRGLGDPNCDHDGIREEAAEEIERLRGILIEKTKQTTFLEIELRYANGAGRGES